MFQNLLRCCVNSRETHRRVEWWHSNLKESLLAVALAQRWKRDVHPSLSKDSSTMPSKIRRVLEDRMIKNASKRFITQRRIYLILPELPSWCCWPHKAKGQPQGKHYIRAHKKEVEIKDRQPWIQDRLLDAFRGNQESQKPSPNQENETIKFKWKYRVLIKYCHISELCQI